MSAVFMERPDYTRGHTGGPAAHQADDGADGAVGSEAGRNTSRLHPAHPVYPYLLRGLKIGRPSQIWATDITYIPMAKGFLYWR